MSSQNYSVVSIDTVVGGSTPDYFLYSADVYGGATYLGGWLTTADVGPDQLYRSVGNETDNATPLAWNGYVPYGTYHVNDPSIVQNADGSLTMFATALPNVDATLELMTEYNQTAMASSTDGGLTWTWFGIVVGENNGYDNTGAWSPSAIAQSNGTIDLWYNTGSLDVVTNQQLPPQVLKTEMDATGTHIQTTEVCVNTATNAPLSLENVDVAQSADGTYWMAANDFGAGAIDIFTSRDGLAWTPLSGGTINVGSGLTLLTPTITSVGDGKINLMVSEKIGDSTVEHTMTLAATTTSSNFEVATVVDGVGGSAIQVTGDVYTGPVSGLTNEFVYLGQENINVVASTPNSFIRGGSGNDALVAQSGNNVIDGGSGSNFLTGGSGSDTFFLDVGKDQSTWSTVNNFHAGDQVTIWSETQLGVSLQWNGDLGATGYTGATTTVSEGTNVHSSLTLVGWGASQAEGLQVQTGAVGGLFYLHFTAN